jgi:hypothetical protein
MGGRGAFSMSGRVASGGVVGAHNLGGMPDKREDIRKSFIDELGFKEVAGTNSIPTATLNSYAIALKQLEREYGAIAASKNPKFLTFNSSDGTLAFVARSKADPSDQIMAINTSVLGKTKTNLATQRIGEKTGHSTKTDGKITSRNAYTVTHEYGHMIHNALASKHKMSVENFSEKAKKEIVGIAQKKYGAKGSVSKYGNTNDREFFAESFASFRSGNPNAYGKAMGDWLKKNRI